LAQVSHLNQFLNAVAKTNSEKSVESDGT
jgi:hypothetical protein